MRLCEPELKQLSRRLCAIALFNGCEGKFHSKHEIRARNASFRFLMLRSLQTWIMSHSPCHQPPSRARRKAFHFVCANKRLCCSSSRPLMTRFVQLQAVITLCRLSPFFAAMFHKPNGFAWWKQVRLSRLLIKTLHSCSESFSRFGKNSRFEYLMWTWSGFSWSVMDFIIDCRCRLWPDDLILASRREERFTPLSSKAYRPRCQIFTSSCDDKFKQTQKPKRNKKQQQKSLITQSMMSRGENDVQLLCWPFFSRLIHRNYFDWVRGRRKQQQKRRLTMHSLNCSASLLAAH